MNTYEVTILNYDLEIRVYTVASASSEKEAIERASRSYRFCGSCTPVKKIKVRKI